MKVTALLPEQLVQDIQRYTKGKTITESLVVALQEWRAAQSIKRLNAQVAATPLTFRPRFSASRIRAVNRRRRTP